VLVPYWAGRLGKTEFTAFQASARGGILHLRLAGDRVKIAGKAVTVIRGEIVV
jgi:predicted PhzF superfamily epimerase YddE/YHI9